MEKIKLSLRQIAEILFVTLGLNIVAFRKRSKAPTGKWEEYQFKRQPESELTKHPWHLVTGVGIILGPVSGVYAFDLDKADSFDIAIQLLEYLGLARDYPWVVKSGSGLGWHIYFKSGDLLDRFNNVSVITIKDPTIKCKQIELRIRCVIVAPGSQHESGGTYEFVNENDFLKPMAMLDVDKIAETVVWLRGTETVSSEPPLDRLEQSKEEGTSIDLGILANVEDCIDQLLERNIVISDDYEKWRDAGFSIANEFAEEGRAVFHRFSSLSSKYNKDECDRVFTKYIESQQSKRTNKKTIKTFFWMCRGVGIKPRGGNRKELDPVKENQFSTAVQIIFMRHKVYRDAFTDTVFVDGNPLSDKIINSIYVFLMSRYNFKKLTKDFIQSLFESEYVEERHRITDLMKNYQPVTREGNIQTLADSLITQTGEGEMINWHNKNRSFLVVIIELFLVKMIKQFYEPVANDICLVLLGPMSIGKTFWLEHLLPRELEDLCAITQFTNDKDFKVELTSKALLIIDEIREKDMSSNEYMKMIMTTSQFSLRVPYARKPLMRKRIASLVGTGNNMFILKDPTGNRRFLPIWLESIDKVSFGGINKMDLFYEAYMLYKSGYDTVVDAKLISVISNISKDFEIRTEADELLLVMCPPADPKNPKATLLSVGEMRDLILERSKKNLNFYNVGIAVDRLGYEGKTQTHKTYNGKISKVWKYYCDVENTFVDQPIGEPDALPTITTIRESKGSALPPSDDRDLYFPPNLNHS